MSFSKNHIVNGSEVEPGAIVAVGVGSVVTVSPFRAKFVSVPSGSKHPIGQWLEYRRLASAQYPEAVFVADKAGDFVLRSEDLTADGSWRSAQHTTITVS